MGNIRYTAVRRAIESTELSMFQIKFDLTLHKAFTQPVDPNQTLERLLVNVVSETLKDPMFEMVIACYKYRDIDTRDYTPVCRQALDLYIASNR